MRWNIAAGRIRVGECEQKHRPVATHRETGYLLADFGIHHVNQLVSRPVPGNLESREAHLNGAIAKALFAKAEELFAKPPQIQQLEIFAAKPLS